ncbi:hypothetical protein J5X84_34270 [Streptosporangiaceae bacterium NEAU-GS5]|nr:hypothetical protein [Streptosporangiaceae bacterium NEAU-GS5]
MTGIWHEDSTGWKPLAPQGFPGEHLLHDNVEKAPEMLPIPGRPRLIVVGREVLCGTGRADLVAVDADTGQPVIIEIKLRKNADRRHVFTQVLDYARIIYRLTPAAFEDLLRPHIVRRGFTSLLEMVETGVQDGSVTSDVFQAKLTRCLGEGRVRCVVVVDEAPDHLVAMAGYLQDVSNDRLDIDLVTVTAYEVGGVRVLVPQLVEPVRLPPVSVAPTAVELERLAVEPAVSRSREAKPVRGAEPFESGIATANAKDVPGLRRLYEWACRLEEEGLVTLYTTVGVTGRWALNLRIPGQQRGMVTVWNDNGPFLTSFRSVIDAVAPKALARLDELIPGEVKMGGYVRSPITDELLSVFRDAYLEALAH